MASITFNQGETHVLSNYFLNEPVAFGPFYLGLGSGGVYAHEAARLSDMNEISGSGYARAPIARDSSVNGWTLRGDYVQSPELRFTNTAVNGCWDPVDYAFLTLSQSGELGDSILIAADEFPNSITLAPGQTLKVVFRFNLRTEGIRYERFHSASGLIIASAIIDGGAETV